MKSYSTVRRRVREARRLIDDPQATPTERRMAQAVEDELRRVSEDVVGWPSLTENVRFLASLASREEPDHA